MIRRRSKLLINLILKLNISYISESSSVVIRSLFGWLVGPFQESLVDDVWMLSDSTLSPEVRWVVFISSLNGSESSFDEISSGSGLSFCFCVNVLNTGELEQFFCDWWGYQTCTSWSWHQSDFDWTGLSCNLVWNGVDGTDLVSPIPLSDWDQIELGHCDGTFDGSLNLFVAFPSESNKLLFITNYNEGFESGSLTCLSLFLNRHYLHDLFFQLFWEESVNDFLFLDWNGESEDIDDAVQKFSLDESTKLGDWFPFVLIFLSVSTSISWFSVSVFTSFFVSGSTESSLLLPFWFRYLWFLLFSH